MENKKPDPAILNEEKLLFDVRQAAAFLDITEKELWELVRKHQVPTQNLAGAFLRFRKTDIEDLKNKWRIERELFPKRSRYFVHESTVAKAGFAEKFADFWYFNDFYIICSALVVILLYIIISFQ